MNARARGGHTAGGGVLVPPTCHIYYYTPNSRIIAATTPPRGGWLDESRRLCERASSEPFFAAGPTTLHAVVVVVVVSSQLPAYSRLNGANNLHGASGTAAEGQPSAAPLHARRQSAFVTLNERAANGRREDIRPVVPVLAANDVTRTCCSLRDRDQRCLSVPRRVGASRRLGHGRGDGTHCTAQTRRASRAELVCALYAGVHESAAALLCKR